MKKSSENLLIPLCVGFAAVLLGGCNSGGGNAAQTSDSFVPVTYAIGSSGELYLNDGSREWLKSDYKPAGTNSTYDINCSFICVAATEFGLSIAPDIASSWAAVTIENGNEVTQMYSALANYYYDEDNVIVGVGKGGKILTASIPESVNKDTKLEITARVNTSVTKNDLFQVSYSPPLDILLAIGTSGTLIKSTDRAKSWTVSEIPTTNNLYAISCEKDNTVDSSCIVIGEDGVILRSIDGKKWSKLVSPTNHHTLYAIVSNDAGVKGAMVYVATGDNVVIYSHDGVNWQASKIPATIANQSYILYNVTHNAMEFIANIELADGSSPNALLTSKDGINWSLTDIKSAVLKETEASKQFMSESDDHQINIGNMVAIVGSSGIFAAGTAYTGYKLNQQLEVQMPRQTAIANNTLARVDITIADARAQANIVINQLDNIMTTAREVNVLDPANVNYELAQLINETQVKLTQARTISTRMGIVLQANNDGQSLAELAIRSQSLASETDILATSLWELNTSGQALAEATAQIAVGRPNYSPAAINERAQVADIASEAFSNHQNNVNLFNNVIQRSATTVKNLSAGKTAAVVLAGSIVITGASLAIAALADDSVKDKLKKAFNI